MHTDKSGLSDQRVPSNLLNVTVTRAEEISQINIYGAFYARGHRELTRADFLQENSKINWNFNQSPALCWTLFVYRRRAAVCTLYIWDVCRAIDISQQKASGEKSVLRDNCYYVDKIIHISG